MSFASAWVSAFASLFVPVARGSARRKAEKWLLMSKNPRQRWCVCWRKYMASCQINKEASQVLLCRCPSFCRLTNYEHEKWFWPSSWSIILHHFSCSWSYLQSNAHSLEIRQLTFGTRLPLLVVPLHVRYALRVWGGWPLPKREGSSDQTDGDFDAAARLPLCLATAHKDMSGPVPSQGGRIRPYSSLYGHDLTNVDISGGGSLVQLSRGDKDDTLWSGWSHCCSRQTAGQIHNWQRFHLRPA